MTPGEQPSRPPRPEEPIARECVEGYLFSNPPLRLLLFRRPPARGSIWVPVSGKVDPDDGSLPAALARELREETGLGSTLPVVSLDWEVSFRADSGEVWRLHAYAVEVSPTFSPQLSHEHDAFEWVDPAEAVRRLHYPDNQAAVARLVDRLRTAARNP